MSGLKVDLCSLSTPVIIRSGHDFVGVGVMSVSLGDDVVVDGNKAHHSVNSQPGENTDMLDSGP